MAFKSLGGIVLFLAVSLGTIGKLAPRLFLYVPKVGFILWAITGNPMPPNIDSSPLRAENFRRLVQDGDCILATGAKSGTIWLQNIVHLLKSNGDDGFENLMDNVGFAEMQMYPEHTLEMRVNETLAKRARLKTRPVPAMTFFSHRFPGQDPALVGMDVRSNPGVKYISIVRNGKEVVRSVKTFLNDFPQEFRDMWGGFPGPAMTNEAALKATAETVPDFYFGYAKGWWALRHEPNVLLLHFTDLKNDLRGTVKCIADFLEIMASAELLEMVAHKAGFEYMKRKDTEKPGCYTPRAGYPGKEIYEKPHIKTGKADGAAEFFTADMNARWEEAVQKHWGDAPGLRAWADNGGSHT